MADTYQTIRCPACGNSMTKIFIPEYGINIDICAEGCGGLFFDAKELQMFQKGSDTGANEINEILEGKTFNPVDENEMRVCPACAAKMVKTRINGLNVQVDTCYNCGGVFLDNGELDLIRAGVKRSTPTAIRAQNSERNNTDMVREFYREAQFEEAENLRNARNFRTASNILFGCGGRRSSYGLIDLLFDLF